MNPTEIIKKPDTGKNIISQFFCREEIFAYNNQSDINFREWKIKKWF
jgi:hypothetical protein